MPKFIFSNIPKKLQTEFKELIKVQVFDKNLQEKKMKNSEVMVVNFK